MLLVSWLLLRCSSIASINISLDARALISPTYSDHVVVLLFVFVVGAPWLQLILSTRPATVGRFQLCCVCFHSSRVGLRLLSMAELSSSSGADRVSGAELSSSDSDGPSRCIHDASRAEIEAGFGRESGGGAE